MLWKRNQLFVMFEVLIGTSSCMDSKILWIVDLDMFKSIRYVISLKRVIC